MLYQLYFRVMAKSTITNLIEYYNLKTDDPLNKNVRFLNPIMQIMQYGAMLHRKGYKSNYLTDDENIADYYYSNAIEEMEGTTYSSACIENHEFIEYFYHQVNYKFSLIPPEIKFAMTGNPTAYLEEEFYYILDDADINTLRQFVQIADFEFVDETIDMLNTYDECRTKFRHDELVIVASFY